jgi:hypothetical protein
LDTVSADVVCLKNGNIIEGIILKDTDKILELEVFLNAKITFTSQDIAYVKRWDDVKNKALKDKWLREKKEREEAERARQEFEAQQRAKGLVKYRGEWITQSEAEKIKTREYVEEALKKRVDGEKIVDSGRKRTDVASVLLVKGNWKNRQTEHFIVYYEDIMQSKLVADRAEYFYEKIIYDLNYEKLIYWPEKCEIFIIPSEEKWQEYMQEFVKRFDHIGGFVPRTGEKEIYLCAISLPYLSITFPHELTHLIFYEFAKGEYIPLWLNEGLAMYESGLIGYADELLHKKVKETKHIPLQELVEMKNYPATKEEMETFYAQAEKTVEFLITQHGRRKFSRFCQFLISGQKFTRALNLVYGDKYYNIDEFKRAWIQYVLK